MDVQGYTCRQGCHLEPEQPFRIHASNLLSGAGAACPSQQLRCETRMDVLGAALPTIYPPEVEGSGLGAGTGRVGACRGSLGGPSRLREATWDGAGAEEGPGRAWGLPAMSLALPATCL